MAALGWITFIFGGAVVAGYAAIAFGLIFKKDGLEGVFGALIGGVVAAVAWLAFALWLSPITIGIAP